MARKRNAIQLILSDRLLQLGLGLLLLCAWYFAQKPRSPSPEPAETVSIRDVPRHLLGELGEADPMILQLPATQDDVSRVAIAQLSGRVVFIRDEAGDWHRMDPDREDDGTARDHSQTLLGVSKLLCMKEGEANPELGLPELTPEQYRQLCELTPAELQPD